jgi:pimeloyl-ACP methyl ester carboxylesterase
MAIQVESAREGPADKTREVLGTATHFHETGAGPMLFYVHDWLETSVAYLPLTEELGPRYRHVAMDLPGFGSTEAAPAWDFSLPAHQEFLGAALQAVGARDTTLVLHGFGHLVGLSALLDRTGEAARRVSRVILLNGPLYDTPRKGLAVLKRAGEFDALTRPPPVDLSGFRKRILDRFANPTYFDDTYVEGLYQAWCFRGPATLRRHAERLAQFKDALPSLRHRLAEWPGELHVLWGADDPLLGESPAARMHHDLPHAKVLLFPDVGNLPHVEAPRDLAAEIRKFVRVSRPPADLR